MEDAGILLAICAALLSGGSAFGGALTALNGTRKRVTHIEAILANHVAEDATHQREVIDRLARIETKLEGLTNAVPKKI